jgi:hypothetical protein
MPERETLKKAAIAAWDREPTIKMRSSLQVRRVDAGMQTAQTAFRRKASYAPGRGWITFIDDDQLR